MHHPISGRRNCSRSGGSRALWIIRVFSIDCGGTASDRKRFGLVEDKPANPRGGRGFNSLARVFPLPHLVSRADFFLLAETFDFISRNQGFQTSAAANCADRSDPLSRRTTASADLFSPEPRKSLSEKTSRNSRGEGCHDS